MNRFLDLMKPVFLTIFAAATGSAFAQGQDPAYKQPTLPPYAVTTISPDYSFEMNFTGLALQPFANNLDYAAVALPFSYGNAQPAVSPNWIIPEIPTDYHFAFDVGIAAVFHNARSSLMLNWEWFHADGDSGSISAPTANDMVGTFFEIGPDASVYKVGTGTVAFHFDEVNLDYGTFVNFGSLLRMNLFAGVSFLYLKEHRHSMISDVAETIVRTIDVPSQFMGAGPQLGLNFNYKIVDGLQFVGNGRASLFVGTLENSTTYSTTSNALALLGDANPNIQTTSVYNKGGIVPGLEGKLGLAYEYLFNCRYLLKIEAGYQAQIYINSLRSIDMGSEVALAAAGSVGSAVTGVYARTFERTVSDFALAGPYATLDLAF